MSRLARSETTPEGTRFEAVTALVFQYSVRLNAICALLVNAPLKLRKLSAKAEVKGPNNAMPKTTATTFEGVRLQHYNPS